MEERLQKFLARAGVASRRKAEVLIIEGHVTVNGAVVRKMGVKVDPERDEIRVDTEVVKAPAAPVPVPLVRLEGAGGAPPRPPEGAVYLLLHKPVGYLSTVTDDRGRKTVMDLMPKTRVRIFPVGRLDEDSEGLLLMTSDGSLTQLLTHPRFEVSKTYDLRIRGEVTAEDVRQVERGVWLSEGRTGPARMRIRKAGREISHVEMTLSEGKNREVRRIFARLRHPVLSLRRTRMGPLELGDLRPGQVRRLAVGEVRALYAMAMGLVRSGAPAAAAPPSRPSPPVRPSRGAKPWKGKPGPKGSGTWRGGPERKPSRSWKDKPEAGSSQPWRRKSPDRPARRPEDGPGGQPARRWQGKPTDRPFKPWKGKSGDRPSRPGGSGRPGGPSRGPRPSKGGPRGKPPRRGGGR